MEEAIGMRLVEHLVIMSDSAGPRGLMWFLWFVVTIKEVPESQDGMGATRLR